MGLLPLLLGPCTCTSFCSVATPAEDDTEKLLLLSLLLHGNLAGGEEVVDCARHNLAWPQQQQQQLQVDPVAGWEPTAQIVADMLKEDLYHLPKEWHPPLQALLEEMLQVDPRLRPTPAQLMQRPIFEDARQQEALHRKRVMMQQ
jgi:serine/threonine protein kinase